MPRHQGRLAGSSDSVTPCARREPGGHGLHVELPDMALPPELALVDMLALDQAPDSIQQLDPTALRVVELRFFAGLSIEETAAALQMHLRSQIVTSSARAMAAA